MPSPQLWLVPPGSPAPAEVLLALSPQERRWGEVLPPRRQDQYWCSRAAIRHLLAEQLGLAPTLLPLHSPPGEPPQLPPALGVVSLSHAGGALLIGWSSQPIGVDLELAERRFDAQALMQRFFPKAEQQQLVLLAPEPLRQAVLRSWLVKEAAIKWRQRTLAEELSAWGFDHRCGLLRHSGDGLELRPAEGGIERWRWAAVAEHLGPAVAAPLTWRFGCG